MSQFIGEVYGFSHIRLYVEGRELAYLDVVSDVHVHLTVVLIALPAIALCITLATGSEKYITETEIDIRMIDSMNNILRYVCFGVNNSLCHILKF